MFFMLISMGEGWCSVLLCAITSCNVLLCNVLSTVLFEFPSLALADKRKGVLNVRVVFRYLL